MLFKKELKLYIKIYRTNYLLFNSSKNWLWIKLLDTKISDFSIVHLSPLGWVTFPPASLTNRTPELISQIFKFLCQNASVLPEATNARSIAAAPVVLKPEGCHSFDSNDLRILKN